MQNEKELIQDCLRGNTEAFSTLVKKYQIQVLRRARTIVRNDADAQDIAQKTFVKAYLNLHTLKRHEKFKNWLFSIVTNESKLWLRDQHSDFVFADSAVFKQNPEEHLVQKELVDTVLQAIDRLPENERRIIEAHLDGKSNQQIAQEQGMSYKAMTHRLYGAKRRVLAQIKRLMMIFPPVPTKIYLKKGIIISMKVESITKIGIGVLGIGLGGWILFNLVSPLGEKTPDSSIRTYMLPDRPKQQSTDASTIKPNQMAPHEKADLIMRIPSDKPLTEDKLSVEEWREFEDLLDELETALSNSPQQDAELEPSEPVGESDVSQQYEALENLIKERISLVRERQRALYEMERAGFIDYMLNGNPVFTYDEGEEILFDALFQTFKASKRSLSRNTSAIVEIFPDAIANVQYDENGVAFVVGGMKLDFGRIERALGRSLPYAQELLWLETD